MSFVRRDWGRAERPRDRLRRRRLRRWRLRPWWKIAPARGLAHRMLLDRLAVARAAVRMRAWIEHGDDGSPLEPDEV